MIPVLTPNFTQENIENIQKSLATVFATGWLASGPKVKEFEEKWAEYTGAKYAVATNSCTAALDIAVRIVSLPETVKVSPFTFASSALAALNAGHKVEFVDIDPESYTTPESDIQVMYAGNIKGTGKIYDMAHCGGYKHLGEVSCWSFHAVKNLPMGDGGMLTMNDPELYRKAKAISWCGIDKSTFDRSKKQYNWDYNIEEVGLKAHMNDVNAVIGLEKLKDLDKENAFRKQIAEAYDRELPDFIKRPYRSSTWHLYAVEVDQRDELLDYLSAHGITCGVHYKPLYKYQIFPQRVLPVTEKVFSRILSLPIHCKMSLSDVTYISDLIRKFYAK